MKLFSKTLMVGLMFGGVILGSSTTVNAGGGPGEYDHTGVATGIVHIKNRKGTYRAEVNSYIGDFNFSKSRANVLFPNDQYTLIELGQIIEFVAKEANLVIPRRIVLRNKVCCYKFIDMHFEVFKEYMDHICLEHSYETDNEMNLSHTQRYALALEMSEHLDKPIPENADKNPLILNTFLVKNESRLYLTDQCAYQFHW